METSKSIAVVGMGCVLPDAPDVTTYWENLKTGHCAIRPLPESRWESRLYLSEDRGVADKAYSRHAGFIEEDVLKKVAGHFKLDWETTPRMQLMALEATRQAVDGLSLEGRSIVSLGCMGQDDGISLLEFGEEKESLLKHAAQWGERGPQVVTQTFDRLMTRDAKSLTFTTSILKKIEQTFGWEGERCLVDAACASSLAALDVAIRYLESGEADFAIAGGMESQLAPENFILFCHLGLHAKERTFPLDDRTEGLNQGEGAGVVALMTLERARAQGFKVLGVIRGCGGSSNGKASSLFSPTAEGQRLALDRANPGGPDLDYLECHATGTRVGDATELEAVDDFLSGSPHPVPIGSVKGLIGHTKGAAGAAGLLKGLLAIAHRTAPPSPYFKKFIGGVTPKHVTIPTIAQPFGDHGRPARVGVSSAGFGGTNYHVLLEAAGEERGKEAAPLTLRSVACVREASYPTKDIRDFIAHYRFPVPPNSLPQIDVLQLAALAAVRECFDRAGLRGDELNGDRTSVLSASCLGLEAYTALARRARHYELGAELGEEENDLFEFLVSHREKFPPVTEDSGPGTLNNVIAGRVANLFNFRGRNYNIDADFNSLPVALKLAQMEITSGEADWVLVLGVDQRLDGGRVVREGVRCVLLADNGAMAQLGLAGWGELKRVTHG